LVLAFGPVIAGLVVEVTDVSRRDICNTPEAKAIDRCARRSTVNSWAGASWRGQMIKCADMLSNAMDIVAHDLGFARIYVPEKKLLIDELTKVRKVSYPIWRAAYDSCPGRTGGPCSSLIVPAIATSCRTDLRALTH
jgi:hypothetical protein